MMKPLVFQRYDYYKLKKNLVYTTLINVTHSNIILLISPPHFTMRLLSIYEHSATIKSIALVIVYSPLNFRLYIPILTS